MLQLIKTHWRRRSSGYANCSTSSRSRPPPAAPTFPLPPRCRLGKSCSRAIDSWGHRWAKRAPTCAGFLFFGGQFIVWKDTPVSSSKICAVWSICWLCLIFLFMWCNLLILVKNWAGMGGSLWMYCWDGLTFVLVKIGFFSRLLSHCKLQI